ncbi:hypothetical protein MTO96_046193 [Rhipicephalus appendiculatus]
MIHPALVASYRGDVSALWWMQQQHRIGALGRGRAGPSLRHVRDSAGAGCAHYAARGGHVRTLRFLVLAAGLRPHERDTFGSTAAHEAAAAGRTRALRWLLARTACRADDRDAHGDTVLHVAARLVAVGFNIFAFSYTLCSERIYRV